MIKDIRMNCMVLAPLKSAGGEKSRKNLEKILKLCWDGASGWNTRLEQGKKMAFSFEFKHQALDIVHTQEELLARMKKLNVATVKKGSRPSQTDSQGGGAAKALFPDGPAPKKPRAG